MFFMFAMVKAIVPRYRYDQLMRLGWKVFLPLSLVMVVVVAGVLQFGERLEEALDHACCSPQAVNSLFLTEFVSALLPGDALLLRAEEDAELPLREGPAVARASAASMRCAAIPTARSAASPASCARRSARRRRSPSRPGRAATTARGARPATTSTW